MIRVKVCGITRLEDARLAAQLGAYAVGFVFWPTSRRYVDPPRARSIVEGMPQGILKVGVFVDQPLELVASVATEVGLSAIQLHGAESIDFARALCRPVIKAVPVDSHFTAALLDQWPDDIMPLLDAHDPVQRGGTGRTIDWSAAAEAAARRPVILAGGLHAGNIRTALARVSPYAVDVSSGVEREPGVKDPVRLRSFFDAIQHD